MIRNNQRLMKYLLIVIFITSATLCGKVYGYTVEVNFAETGETLAAPPEQSKSQTYRLMGCPFPSNLPQGATIQCSISYDYSWKVTYDEKITINAYDMYDNPLLENSLMLKEPIIAGTSIGISMYSKKDVGYKVELKVTYNYAWQAPNPAYPCPTITEEDIKNGIIPNLTNCRSPFIGGAGSIPITETEKNAILKAEYEKIKTAAINDAVEDSYEIYLDTSTYTVVLPDSNDINGNEITEADDSFECYDAAGNIFEDKLECDYVDETRLEDKRTQITYFTIDKACMDVKTSKVRYITGDSLSKNCENGEIEISNGTSETIDPNTGEKEIHWHFFTPLNAKSTDKVPINIRYHWMSEKDFKQCHYVMKNNPIDYLDTSIPNPIINPNRNGKAFYTELITKKDDTPFSGDYYKCDNLAEADFDTNCALMSDDYREILNNGCRISMQTYLPIDQQFYNEETDDKDVTWLKGFGFYYRPININNPFPNGIEENSIWNNYYDETKNEILKDNLKINDNLKISNSYNEVTYKTNINAKKIKEYNANNSYASWKDMNLDGTSNFIDNTIINRISSTNDIYKLGCGPLNTKQYLDKEMTKENPLYQEECSK